MNESLSIYEIIGISMHDDALRSKVCRSISAWQTIHHLDVEALEKHLFKPYKLVRFKGPNKEAIRERMRMPILCECGCTVIRGTIWRHRKTMNHKTMLEEALHNNNSISQ